jgi:hypothetical protein
MRISRCIRDCEASIILKPLAAAMRRRSSLKPFGWGRFGKYSCPALAFHTHRGIITFEWRKERRPPTLFCCSTAPDGTPPPNSTCPATLPRSSCPSRAPELNPVENVRQFLAAIGFQTRLRHLRRHHRRRLRRLARTHRQTTNHHLHRHARVGSHRSDPMTLGMIHPGVRNAPTSRKDTIRCLSSSHSARRTQARLSQRLSLPTSLSAG